MKFRYKMPNPIGFQLAPMLDIVFLLLVFFVVTQTLRTTNRTFPSPFRLRRHPNPGKTPPMRLS